MRKRRKRASQRKWALKRMVAALFAGATGLWLGIWGVRRTQYLRHAVGKRAFDVNRNWRLLKQQVYGVGQINR